LGLEASQHEAGIFRVAGLPFTAWLVETDVMAERGQPVLSLVSRVFLNDRGRIIEKLERTGHESLLRYMVQQIKQFHAGGEDFAMQHGLSDDLQEMQEVEEELLTKILEDLPPERRLRGLPPEERLRGLSSEELLRALPPEFVAGLSEEQAARLRELLQRKQGR